MRRNSIVPGWGTRLESPSPFHRFKRARIPGSRVGPGDGRGDTGKVKK